MRNVWRLALLLSACAEVGPECVPADPAPVIGVAEGAFVSADGPVVPRAINSYPLLDHAGWDEWDDVASILDQARALGRPVIRTGAYMIGGRNPARLRDERGALREEGLARLDRILAMAAERDVQLLLITANHWGDYGGAPAVVEAVAPGEGLPVEAFYTDARAIAHQQDYLTALASHVNLENGRRYADDPTIFAWELVNEA
ncbi:MAG: hypothetical protein KC619_34390, partial [Myxococcales bacterium]|nr:hypothetical protein [Myxococcales bacterium]